jgi:hypothetical protein
LQKIIKELKLKIKRGKKEKDKEEESEFYKKLKELLKLKVER